MSVNFENLDSYEALEEILNWKRTKQKRHKTKDKIDVEISIKIIEMENPIKENRYVNDITFATRLKSFIEHTGKNYGSSDFLIDEEWEYLLSVATKLVNWQRENMTEEE